MGVKSYVKNLIGEWVMDNNIDISKITAKSNFITSKSVTRLQKYYTISY